MSSTLAGVEVTTTAEPTTSLIPPTPRIVPIPVRQTSAKQEAVKAEQEKQEPAEQLQSANSLFWLIAPLSLLITGSATFLLVRRWLKRSRQDRDELA